MKIKKVLIAALLLSTSMVDVASAAPIGAVIGAIAAATGASTATIALIGINLLVSGTMSLIQMARMKKAQDGRGGVKTDVLMNGGINSRSFILGRYMTAGAQLCPPMVAGRRGGGTTNAYRTSVIAVSDLPIKGLSRIAIDGEYTAINSETMTYRGNPLLGKFNKEDGLGWMFFHDGTQTAANEFLIEQFSTYPNRPWNVNMIGSGMAYAVMTFRWDNEYSTGVPEIKFEIDGLRLYDPRRDSSVGGSGTHRLNNPSTWGGPGDNNPVVMIYNILIGIKLTDGRVWGADAEQADLPLSNWAAAMNICDEQVSLPGGGTENRYRAGCEVYAADDQPGDIIDDLLLACSGQIVEIGGVYKIRAGGPGLPIAFLTDDDFLISKPQDFDPFPPKISSVNSINASFPHPDELWQPHDAPVRTVQSYVDEDGEIRSTSLSLNAVPYPNQVQRNMLAWLRDDRNWRSHVGYLGPYGFALEPLDVFEWSSDRNGYINKRFDIQKTSENLRTVISALSFRETNPSDYDWQPGFTLPDSVTPGGWEYPDPHAVPGFGVAPFSILDAASKARKPAIRAFWDGDAVRDATALKIMVRRAGTVTIVTDKTVTKVTEGYTTISEGLLPDTAYEVSAIYVVSRPVIASSWFPVTTPDVAPVQPEDISPDVWEEMTEIAESAGIPAGPELPAAGTKPNQLFFLVPPGRLYRWNADINEWTTDVYAGIPDGAIDATKFAQGLEPVSIIAEGDPLPTTKTTSVIVFQGKSYRWDGTKYTSAITPIDIPANAVSPDKLSVVPGYNLSPDPYLEFPALWNSTQPTRWVQAANKWVYTHNATGFSVLNLIKNISVAPNSRYRFTAKVNAITAAALRIWATYYDLAENQVGTFGQNGISIAAATPTTFTYAADAPANAVKARFRVEVSVNGSVEFTSFEFINITNADTIADSAVTTAKIADAAIAAGKLADGVATAAKIATGAITETKIADNAITSPKLIAGAVTAGKVSAGAIEAGNIAAGAITAGKIAAGAITAGKIAANAVTATNLTAGAVEADKIAANAVNAGKIAAGAIEADKIAANAVTVGKIAANAVTANTIATNAVTSDAIMANAITTAKIQAGAVRADQIAANAIIASKLMVADFSNLIVNNWTGGDFDGWATNGNAEVQNRTDNPFNDAGIAGNMVVYSGGDNWISSSRSTISNQESYYFEVYIRRSSAQIPDGVSWVQARWTLNDGSLVYTTIGTVSNNSTVKVSKIVNAPANAVNVSMWLRPNVNGTSGTVFLARPVIRRANSGELYVDGSITTNALSAGSVTTDVLAASAVVTSKIAAGAVVAATIAANAITSSHIMSRTIIARHLTLTEAVITGTAQINDLIITSAKIGRNELYIPYFWAPGGSVEINTTYNYASPRMIMERNVENFEGGGFVVIFTAFARGWDAFGTIYLEIDGVKVTPQRFGVRADGGSNATYQIPVTTSGQARGTTATNIKVYAYNSHWNSDQQTSNTYRLENLRITLSGTRR